MSSTESGSETAASASAAAAAAAGVGAAASTAATPASSSSSDTTPLLHLDDPLRNDVLSAGAEHRQEKIRPLSSLEQFYVHVAEVFQHQTLHAPAASAAAAAAAPPASSSHVWPFARMEKKIGLARWHVENIAQIIDQLLTSSGKQRAAVQAPGPPRAGQPRQQQPVQPPQPAVLGMVERNTEMYDRKLKEDAAMLSEQHRLDRENAGMAAGGNAAMGDGAEGDEAPTAEEELADFLRDEDAEGGDGDDVRMILDPSDQMHGGVSLATRRNRLGTLLMLKRRQYTDARDVCMRGADALRRSIQSDRNFLEGVGQLAKYWTVRTVANDAGVSMQGSAHAKGPPVNPYQIGRSAGSITPYPSLAVDYRLGTLDLSLDRGNAWLYRNDAGDVLVDESVGRDAIATAAPATVVAAAKEEHPAVAVKREGQSDESKESKEAEADAAAPAAPAAVPSWVNVTARLQRAQHQLLYKHLYNALMTEARDLRVGSHKEQLRAAAHAHNSHAAAASTSAAAAAASAAAFIPPPAAHTPRPWSVVDIAAHSIRIDTTGFEGGVALEWQQGISGPFRVLAGRGAMEGGSAHPSSTDLPLHLSQLLCNQCLCLWLEHTQKGSVSNRRALELMGEPDGHGHRSAARGVDVAVSATGVGSSGTGQEESGSPKPLSMLQFVVMAVNHWRLVREVRQAMRGLRRRQAGSQLALPPFRIKEAQTKQPYIYAFTVLVGKRFVLEASIRGLHFQVVTRLPPTLPAALTYASFGQAAPSPSLARPFAPEDYTVADTILCTSAQHFIDVLTRALSWHK